MASLYSDQHASLRDLLSMAGKAGNATLLIPDLQRPYIWTPTQVVGLVDSLIRGWPFGTLLTWKVKSDDPVRALARAFWEIADRTEEDEEQAISQKHPPAAFHMVLDGQQRVQSLLLAFGGSGSGFKMLDRKWHEDQSGTKPRGPRGKPHWSLGCLCVNVPALTSAYATTKRATAIDYQTVLQWVITDSAKGQSSLAKPANYNPPLEIAAMDGRFIRLSRLWDSAPEQAGIDPYEAEELASTILYEHGATVSSIEQQKRSVGALITALKDVKQTRVTFLELAEYEAALGSRGAYNDAVVNIFTRLNTAGRTLTREDITFAWLKVGWRTERTQNRSAKECVETLAKELQSLDVDISVEDVVSAISFLWSVSFNSGKLLNNDDLMRGDAITPMAGNVSENWQVVTEAVITVCQHARNRGLRFREHYQSVNALAYLWAWCFGVLRWREDRDLHVLLRDSLEKRLAETLDRLMDRWLVCTQWAGIWAKGSAQNISGYASRLALSEQSLANESDVLGAIRVLEQRLESELQTIEQAAVNGFMGISADDRQQVRGYYTALWLWNRMETNRWESAKLALRQKGRKQSSIEVDHIVAYELWQSKLSAHSGPLSSAESGGEGAGQGDLFPIVNELGNCMLLEKNFNISKSSKPLYTFLADMHEFKCNTLTIERWSNALSLAMPHVDSAKTAVTELAKLINERTQKIRSEMEQFIRGTKARIDL